MKRPKDENPQKQWNEWLKVKYLTKSASMRYCDYEVISHKNWKHEIFRGRCEKKT